MKRRPIILLFLIVVLPVFVLAGAARRLAERESQLVQQRFRDLMEDRLRDANAGIASHFERVSTSLRRITAVDDFDVTALRQIVRNEPLLLQLFVLSPDGQLQYPNPAEPLNSTEQRFLLRAASMFTGQDLQHAVALAEVRQGDAPVEPADPRPDSLARPVDSNALPSPAQQQQFAADLTRVPESSGWFVWYWEQGLHLIFWQRRPSGHVVGAALERARWMSDLLAELPETKLNDSVSVSSDRSVSADRSVPADRSVSADRSVPADRSEPASAATSSRIQLVNSAASSVYQWGGFEVPDGSEPLCELPVSAPLASWRLKCFVSVEQLEAGTGGSVWLGLAGGLLSVGLAIAVCAVVLFRDYARDMREARQEVSFVNQVSHELKTPLTNIRLYAELLERDLDRFDDADTDRPRKRLQVILGEGQRLSRLVGNVLTFARQQRRTLHPRPTAIAVDDVLQKIVERFRPLLNDLSIDVSLQLAAAEPAEIDADFLEQIIGNLISNVEKYAAAGGALSLCSRIENGTVIIEVADSGPGIPVADRERVFRPFARGSNDINAPAGTGIGLSIARELSRLHGGDLSLLDNQPGCRFRVSLKIRNGASDP